MLQWNLFEFVKVHVANLLNTCKARIIHVYIYHDALRKTNFVCLRFEKNNVILYMNQY